MDQQSFECEFKDCKSIYENPITLPCGNSICSKHLDQYDQKFVCQFCQDEHVIPKQGFAINKSIIKLINNFNESNKMRKKIKDVFENVNKLINSYENIDSDSFVSDYFSEIRNQADLHREELIKEINARHEVIINQLKEKEEKCLQNISKLVKENYTDVKTRNLEISKQFQSFPFLSQSDFINDVLLSKKYLTKIINKKINFFLYDLLMNEFVHFEKCEINSSVA